MTPTSLYSGSRFRRAALARGRGTTVRQAIESFALSADGPGKGVRHPWQVSCEWQAQGAFGSSNGRWVATVKPGFVNGRAPIWRTTVKQQAAAGRDYGINPLSGQRFFSSFVFSQSADTDLAALIDIPIYLNPAIALPWRGLGYDGDVAHAVPQFFKDRGAADSPLLNLDLSGPLELQALSRFTETPKKLRLLRACDIWVHQPRPALTSTIEVLPGAVTGMFTFHQTLGEAPPDHGDVLCLRSGNFEAVGPSLDPLTFNYTEFPWDEKLLATVYLLSPENAKPGAEPDGSWTPCVQHEVWRNLSYATPAFRQPVEGPGITLLPLLGTAVGAFAAPIINYVSSEINDGYQRALNLVQGHSLQGRFWVATGGGSANENPVEPVIVKEPGMRERPVIPKMPQLGLGSLDPAFPYRGLAFDLSLLKTI